MNQNDVVWSGADFLEQNVFQWVTATECSIQPSSSHDPVPVAEHYYQAYRLRHVFGVLYPHTDIPDDSGTFYFGNRYRPSHLGVDGPPAMFPLEPLSLPILSPSLHGLTFRSLRQPYLYIWPHRGYLSNILYQTDSSRRIQDAFNVELGLLSVPPTSSEHVGMTFVETAQSVHVWDSTFNNVGRKSGSHHPTNEGTFEVLKPAIHSGHDVP
jgi:hypothetical protein